MEELSVSELKLQGLEVQWETAVLLRSLGELIVLTHVNHFSICCRFWLEWPSSTRSHRHTRTNMQAGVQDCGVGVCPGTRLGSLGIDSTVIWIAHPEETGVRTGQRWLISSDLTLKIWTRGLFHVKTDSFCDENKKIHGLGGWKYIWVSACIWNTVHFVSVSFEVLTKHNEVTNFMHFMA